MADQLSPTEILLRDEYFHLQKTIEDFDSKSIAIKTWSISGSLVIIGAGLSDKGSKELFIVGAIASLLFWYIEGNWKGFQQSFFYRIHQIEDYFVDSVKNPTVPLQISRNWSKSWNGEFRKKIFQLMLWPGVMLPHILLFVGGICLYIFDCNGVINIHRSI